MPQLDFSFFLSQITWLVVSFFIFFGICKFLILPRLNIILQTRSNIINDNIEFVNKMTEKANRLIDDCNKKMENVKKSIDNQITLCVKECKDKQHSAISQYSKDINVEFQRKILEVKNEILSYDEKINKSILSIVKELLMKVYSIDIDEKDLKKSFKKIEL